MTTKRQVVARALDAFVWVVRRIFIRPVARTCGGLEVLSNGLTEEYPLCCVTQFALGHTLGARAQACRRGGVTEGDKTWVTCSFHTGRHPLWEPPYYAVATLPDGRKAFRPRIKFA